MSSRRPPTSSPSRSRREEFEAIQRAISTRQQTSLAQQVMEKIAPVGRALGIGLVNQGASVARSALTPLSSSPSDLASTARTVADMTPGLGDALAVKDALSALADRRWIEGVLAAGSILPIIPRLKPGANALEGTRVVDSSGQPRRVYHGTPRNFQSFDPTYLKDGLYGPGIYFADDPRTAQSYANRFGGGYDAVNTIQKVEAASQRVKWLEEQLAVVPPASRKIYEVELRKAQATIQQEIDNFSKYLEAAGASPNIRPARLALKNPFDADKNMSRQEAYDFVAAMEYQTGKKSEEALELIANSRYDRVDSSSLYYAFNNAGVSGQQLNEALTELGYDGIVFNWNSPEDRAYVAFDSEQVRSAFGPPELAARAGRASPAAALLAGGVGAAGLSRVRQDRPDFSRIESGSSSTADDSLAKLLGYDVRSAAQQDTLQREGILGAQRATYDPVLSEAAYRNITPYAYGGHEGQLVNAARDILGGLTSRLKPSGTGSRPTEGPIREDIWRMYLGMPMETRGQINVSPTRPSVERDSDATYYSIARVDEDIKKSLPWILQSLSNDPSDEDGIDAWSDVHVDKSGNKYLIIADSGAGALGKFKVSLGEDEKGHYVSYYDKWDLDFEEIERSIGDEIDILGNEGIGGMARRMLAEAAKKKGVGPESVGRPLEFYNRIYFDPETRKPIDK